MEIYIDKPNGRLCFDIDGVVVVSATNDCWKVGDQSGSGAITWVKMNFDNTKCFWTIEFSDTTKIYIDGD